MKDLSREEKMKWLLAAILYHHEARPDHLGAIREVLDYPSSDELRDIVIAGKRRSNHGRAE